MKNLNDTMLIDSYELTMAQTYFDNNDNTEVTFDVFFRKNPFNSGYTIMGGLDNIINYILNLKFTDEDIEYLRSTNQFTEEFLSYLKSFKFTGDIYSMVDGTVVFPNEPVITVKANLIEAQIIETALLTHFNHGSLVLTKARRIVEAAKGKGVFEFGARRARGTASAYESSKYALMAGCVGTSNVKVASDLGIKATGTMAHSLVTYYEDEYEAFLTYAKSNPDNCVFLVDTYDTLRSGVVNAIKVADDYLTPNGIEFKGIRIDSGDLAYLSKEARKMLDEAGYVNAKIVLSNGLDEDTITSLIQQGACFDYLGVGDNISASLDRLGGVYKLSSVKKDMDFVPRIKISDDKIKIINPGFKEVYRFYDKESGYALGDVICLKEEKINPDIYTLTSDDGFKSTTLTNYDIVKLQRPIFINGKLVYDIPSIEETKDYIEQQMKTIYSEIKRALNPHVYYVDLSDELRDVKEKLIYEHKMDSNLKVLEREN